MELVHRLDGLPLALTSAASFLERTSCTAQEYLEEYKRNWVKNDAENLFEYGDRTLFTTWNMSFEKIKNQDASAAELLRISAFFSNENIDYTLLAARAVDVWPKLADALRTKATFDSSMAKLRDYSLIETTHRGYRLHPCVHDWTLSNLNQSIEESDVWSALNCTVAASETGTSYWATDFDQYLLRLSSHATRLTQPLLYDILAHSELDQQRCACLAGLSNLLHHAGRTREALPLVSRSLLWLKKHLGEEHETFLYTCNMVGLLQKDLSNFSQAENLLKNAVYGRARVLGPYDMRTLDPVHNMGILYQQFRRFEEAEQMYLWSLSGCEESYGPEDVNTFWAMMALAELYMAKGEDDNAAEQFRRALEGFDASIDKDHPFSRRTASSLGAIYERKEDYDSAKAMYQRVYESCQKVFGLDHWSTLEAKADLDELQSKCLSKANDGTSLVTAESGSASPIEQSDVADPPTSDIKVIYPPQGTEEPEEPFTIPFNPSKSGTLCCNDCNTVLTTSTERFICCFCDDHELCGSCHTQFRTKRQNNPEQGEQHTRHVFLSCEFTQQSLDDNHEEVAALPWTGVNFGSNIHPDVGNPLLAPSSAAGQDGNLNWGADLTLNSQDDHNQWVKLGIEN